MRDRGTRLVLLLTLLAACEAPTVAPRAAGLATPATAVATPAAPPLPSPATAAPSPSRATATDESATATPTRPAGRPPRPSPDPAAVAAGASLRATLLAQLDEVERRCRAGTPGVTSAPSRPCVVGAGAGFGSSLDVYWPPELKAYSSWYNWITNCHYNATSSTGYAFTGVAVLFTVEQLRDPGLLDVYVSGTPWCGHTRPGGSPAPTPSSGSRPRPPADPSPGSGVSRRWTAPSASGTAA